MVLRQRRTSYCRVVEILVVAGLMTLTTGCLHRHHRTKGTRGVPQQTAAPGQQPVEIVQGEEGIASWYGRPYHGRQAASGEIYNMYAMTAAHRTLPFGTRVKVHDLENGRDVMVRINDRGPFVEGRIIDLSYAAAQEMRMPGIAMVRLEILGITTENQAGAVFAVQVGAFRDQNNAERLKQRIESQFSPVIIQDFDSGDGILYRVRVGQESTEEGARSLAQKLRAANLATVTFTVRLN